MARLIRCRKTPMAGGGCRYHSLVEKIKRLFLTRCDLLLWKAAGQELVAFIGLKKARPRLSWGKVPPFYSGGLCHDLWAGLVVPTTTYTRGTGSSVKHPSRRLPASPSISCTAA